MFHPAKKCTSKPRVNVILAWKGEAAEIINLHNISNLLY